MRPPGKKAATGMALALTALGFVLAGCVTGGPGKAERHYDAGVELQAGGRPQEAIAEYDEAIRRDPEMAVAYNGRGLAYDELGQHQRAIRNFDDIFAKNDCVASPIKTLFRVDSSFRTARQGSTTLRNCNKSVPRDATRSNTSSSTWRSSSC